MSEENKNTANEQEETEKDIPETETVNEPTEESPEATAGQEQKRRKPLRQTTIKKPNPKHLSSARRKKTIN